jgi:hypothetical protein
MLLALSPFKFKEILKHMGYKNGCRIELVSEYLSTKTCSACGNIYEIGDSKQYICPNPKCNMKADRDENSAKTHLKLGLMADKEKKEKAKILAAKKLAAEKLAAKKLAAEKLAAKKPIKKPIKKVAKVVKHRTSSP